jgi:hypothetical protein
MLIAAPGSICEVWLVMGVFENAVEDVRKLLIDLSNNFMEGARIFLLSRLNIETTRIKRRVYLEILQKFQ